MRTGTVLLLLTAIAWARDCPFCEKPMVAVPVQKVVHYFCSACSATIYANPDGSETASVRVRGSRRTFVLDEETVRRRHWDLVSLEDLEPDATENREGGAVAPGHPVSRPSHPVVLPSHPVSRPRHPVAPPAAPVERPSHSVKRPAHAVQRPAPAVQRPAPAVQRPAHAVQRPTHAVQLPAPAVQRPSHPVSLPSHPVSRPGHPVSRPGQVQANTPGIVRKSDGPALVLAPREWSPPVRRAPPRRYG